MGSKHDSNLDQDCEILVPSPANDRQDIEGEHSLDSSEQGTNASGVVLCGYATVVSEDRRASDQDCEILVPSPANDRQDMKGEHSLDSSEQGTNASGVVLCGYETVVSEDSKASEDDYSHNNYDTDDKDENYEEEGDDELTKRIEEFIARVIRERKAEMLRTSSTVWRDN